MQFKDVVKKLYFSQTKFDEFIEGNRLNKLTKFYLQEYKPKCGKYLTRELQVERTFWKEISPKPIDFSELMRLVWYKVFILEEIQWVNTAANCFAIK